MDPIFNLNTPCYIYDEVEFLDNLQAFRSAMEDVWSRGPVRMGISVKTAPVSGVIALARSAGYSAEVVSDEEFSLALSSGFNPNEVIFNGPIKSREWVDFALDSGAIVNLDSWREIRYAAEYASKTGAEPKVGLRVNFDLERACPGETSAGREPARFGFCVENGSLAKAISYLRGFGIEPVGLHLHSSTESHSLNVYRAICDEVLTVSEKLSLSSLQYIDIGGGFYGGGTNRGAYDGYARTIAEGLASLMGDREIEIILEPGGSVLATSAVLAGKVIDSKVVRESRFVITELSKLCLNSTMFSRRSFICEPRVSGRRGLEPTQTICGYTCMEMDRIANVEGWPALEEGDIVLVHNAGAYAASFAPGFFIKEMPSVYLKSRDGSFSALELRASPKPPDVGGV